MAFLVSYLSTVLGWARDEDEGQTMAEYGLILAGIAVVVMVAVGVLGTALAAKFGQITALLG